jgi:hypothetical protein
MIILLILLLHHLGNGHANRDAKTEVAALPVETVFDLSTNTNAEPAIGYATLSAETTVEASSWELRKHDDDVFIYQRWVDAEPGRKARELYAEIRVKSTPEQLAQIIRNEKYGTEWLSMADEYKVLNQNSDAEWYAYSRFNFLPALRFDLVTRNEMTVNSAEHSVIIGISGQPNYLPENKKYRRLSHFEGKWEFVSTDGTHCLVRYYMFSKTKPFLPRWITDPFVFGEMENCVSNVKEIAERL